MSTATAAIEVVVTLRHHPHHETGRPPGWTATVRCPGVDGVVPALWTMAYDTELLDTPEAAEHEARRFCEWKGCRVAAVVRATP